MKLWSTWLPDLLPHLPECPIPVVQFELLRAAQTFFQKTRAWRVVQPVVPVSALQASVTVVPADSGQELVRVEAGWYDGKPLDKATTVLLDRKYGDDWHTHTGTPGAMYQETPGVVGLYPRPIAAAVTGLKLQLSVRPSEAATGLPDDMAVEYRDELTSGAKARLMLYPGKKWSNPDMALVHDGLFTAAMNRANVDASQSFMNARTAGKPLWC